MNALILVDLQNDFLPGGALAVPGGDEVISVANRLQGAFSVVVATRDWHPLDHCSFADNHPGRSVGEMTELDGLEQILWPVHCVRKTSGAQFAVDLELWPGTKVISKGTDTDIDSYSGFFDNTRRRSTGLDELLRAAGVTGVYVLGLATDYCVRFTALDAASLGFGTYLIEDGCRGVDLRPGDVKHAIHEMRRAGVTVLKSGDVLQQ